MNSKPNSRKEIFFALVIYIFYFCWWYFFSFCFQLNFFIFGFPGWFFFAIVPGFIITFLLICIFISRNFDDK